MSLALYGHCYNESLQWERGGVWGHAVSTAFLKLPTVKKHFLCPQFFLTVQNISKKHIFRKIISLNIILNCTTGLVYLK